MDRSDPYRSGRYATRLYRWALTLLPPSVREEDGREMESVFEELWRNADGFAPRARLGLRAFGRLPWVALAEWTETLGWVRAPGSGLNPGRSGMADWMSTLRYVFRTLRKAPAFVSRK